MGRNPNYYSQTQTVCAMRSKWKISTKTSIMTSKLFDTSNYPKDHSSKIPMGKSKKVIGMFKDKAGGKITQGFVGLRAKLYTYKMLDGKEEKKCKGIRKPVIKKDISFDDYRRCLFAGS